MNERQKRLIEVYDHLRRHFGIHTKTGFAEAVRYGRTSMSAALNGDDDYLTDNLFKKICEAYPGTFNLDYLLSGDGALLTIDEEIAIEKVEKLSAPVPPPAIDTSFMIEKAVEKATAYADRLIASLEKQVTDKDNQLKEKDEMIAMLRRRIAELEATQVIYDQRDPSKDYPFTTGVADKQDNVTTRV